MKQIAIFLWLIILFLFIQSFMPPLWSFIPGIIILMLHEHYKQEGNMKLAVIYFIAGIILILTALVFFTIK